MLVEDILSQDVLGVAFDLTFGQIFIIFLSMSIIKLDLWTPIKFFPYIDFFDPYAKLFTQIRFMVGSQRAG